MQILWHALPGGKTGQCQSIAHQAIQQGAALPALIKLGENYAIKRILRELPYDVLGKAALRGCRQRKQTGHISLFQSRPLFGKAFILRRKTCAVDQYTGLVFSCIVQHMRQLACLMQRGKRHTHHACIRFQLLLRADAITIH